MAVDKRESRLELTAVDQASAVIKKVKGSVDELRSSIDTVKDAMLAVGVVVGAGAMGKLYLDVIKSDAALVDFSASTGASVENLSKLQQIAKLGGQDFGGFTDQLARMVKGLKSGNEEGQVASHALSFLGVAAKDSNGVFRDTGDIAFDVAKALSRYADDGNKVALVQDALGKGAQRYLPLLKDMVQYGNTAAVTTTEQAKQAKEFEVAINSVNIALENSRRALVVEYVPALTRFIEQMAEGIRIAGGFGAAMLNFGTMNPDPGAAIASANTDIDRLLERQKGYHDPAEDAGLNRLMQLAQQRRTFAQFLQRQQALEGRTGDDNLDARDLRSRDPKASSGYQSPNVHADQTELRLYTRAMQQLEEELGKLQDLSKAQIVINRVTTGSWKDLTDEHKAALIAEAGEFDDRKNHIAVIEAEYGALTVLIQRRQQEDALFERSFTSNKAALDARVFEISLIGRTAFEQQKLTAARQIDLETKERTRQALDSLPEDAMSGDIMRVIDQYAAAGEAQKRVVLAQLEVQRAAERSFVTGAKGAFSDYAESATNAALQARLVFGNAFQNMEDALVAFARTGKLNFRNFADSLITDILRVQTRMYITGPLAQMGSTFLSSAGSSIGSALGFANGGVMSGAGSAPLTRYANGGVATSPQLAEFGEGPTPEAFVPLPDGRTIPVTMRGGMGGGDTYNIDARGADSVAIARLESTITQMRGEVRYIAVDAVQREAAKRGKRLW